ncbi:MAG: D-alanyl-D-alanine carboxypeptidase [Clostridia bacterium]|nr:D-alanyl-D-alanine carboxypeptidase [Clostridia bacterium]
MKIKGLKKLIIFNFIILFSISLLCFSVSFSASMPQELKSESVVLIEAQRGQILYEKDIHKRLHISIACKIMTAVLAMENGKPDSKITISKESVQPGTSSLNLEVGGKYAMEDLLYAILLSPANDAAISLAEYISGDTGKFVDLMNRKASELNLNNTFFKNPTGLFDKAQYTTAADLSVLLRYALNNPTFNRIFATKAKPWSDKKRTSLLINQNKLLWSLDGADGGKAGYNHENRQSAITTATRGNQKLISIVLDCPKEHLFTESSLLVEYGFSYFRKGTLVLAGQPLKTIEVEEQEIPLITLNDVFYTFPKEDNYIKEIQFSLPGKPSLPLTKDKVVGTAQYTLKDNFVITVDLYPVSDILPKTSSITSLFSRITENKDIFLLILFLSALELFLIAYHLTRFLKNKNHLRIKRK